MVSGAKFNAKDVNNKSMGQVYCIMTCLGEMATLLPGNNNLLLCRHFLTFEVARKSLWFIQSLCHTFRGPCFGFCPGLELLVRG